MSLTFENPHKDTRLEGILIQNASIGTSTHYHNFAFDCNFNGMMLGSSVTKYGSYISVQVEYYVPPLQVWKRHKKFGKKVNLHPNHVSQVLLFPAKPTVGTRLAITINNQEASGIDVALDLFKFIDLKEIDPSKLEEGEDW